MKVIDLAETLSRDALRGLRVRTLEVETLSVYTK